MFLKNSGTITLAASLDDDYQPYAIEHTAKTPILNCVA
jgi:hypothetical protein